MAMHRITDWNDAYANSVNIGGGDRWPAAWTEPAQRFRDAAVAAGRADGPCLRGRRKTALRPLPAARRARGLVVYIQADSGGPSTSRMVAPGRWQRGKRLCRRHAFLLALPGRSDRAIVHESGALRMRRRPWTGRSS